MFRLASILLGPISGLVVALAPGVARAEEPRPPDEALAFITGASIFVVGLGAGAVLASGNAGRTHDNIGWLGMNTALTLAPFAGHAVVGEWGRGLLFAAPPAASLVATGTLFAIEPDAVRHGDRVEQRYLWAFFSTAVVASAIGVVDAAFAAGRHRTVSLVPRLGPGIAGLELRGTL